MFPKRGEATLTCCKVQRCRAELYSFVNHGWSRFTSARLSTGAACQKSQGSLNQQHLIGSSRFHMEMMRVLILKPAPVPWRNPPALHNDPNPLMLTVRMFFFIYFAGFCFIFSVFKCFSSNNEARWNIHQCCSCSRSRAFPRGKTAHDGGRFTVSPPASGLLEFHNSQQKCDGWWWMNDDESL